jgi:hypothetical protein
MVDTVETTSLELVAAPAIEKRILVVRGRPGDARRGLADLYGVETKRLIQQVKRNIERFPTTSCFSWSDPRRQL